MNPDPVRELLDAAIDALKAQQPQRALALVRQAKASLGVTVSDGPGSSALR